MFARIAVVEASGIAPSLFQSMGWDQAGRARSGFCLFPRRNALASWSVRGASAFPSKQRSE